MLDLARLRIRVFRDFSYRTAELMHIENLLQRYADQLFT